MNIVTMSGRLCKEPELRRINDGTACCSFTLAVKRPKTKDTTDFHDCVVWRQGAEYLCQYGHKGDLVCVSGPLTTREWTDKEGKKRKTYEVVTTSVELLSSKRNSEVGGNTNQNQNGFQGHAYQPQQNKQPQYNQQGFGGYIDPDAQLPF